MCFMLLCSELHVTPVGFPCSAPSRSASPAPQPFVEEVAPLYIYVYVLIAEPKTSSAASSPSGPVFPVQKAQQPTQSCTVSCCPRPPPRQHTETNTEGPRPPLLDVRAQTRSSNPVRPSTTAASGPPLRSISPSSSDVSSRTMSPLPGRCAAHP